MTVAERLRPGGRVHEIPYATLAPVGVGALFRPGMRSYFIPLVAGVALAVSAFLPWVVVGDVALKGLPDVAALWVAGLGVAAVVLATLSLITRRNSRHPL